MADLESAFEKLIGRQPSDREVQALYRVKNALGIRDNDALWVVIMALESYDSLYRRYPAMISGEVRKLVDEQRVLISEMADAESKRALGTLAQAVSDTSKSIASKTADASLHLAWGWMLLGLLGFGSLCVFVGVAIASGRPPYWTGQAPGDDLVLAILTALARTPAGWIAAVGGTGAAMAALYRARAEVLAGARWGLLASAVALALLSCLFFIPVLKP